MAAGAARSLSEVLTTRAAAQGGEGSAVNHPRHYNEHPSGVECITVVEHLTFNVGNAVKYLWRAGLKGGSDKKVQDLEKAEWYIRREIQKLKQEEARVRREAEEQRLKRFLAQAEGLLELGQTRLKVRGCDGKTRTCVFMGFDGVGLFVRDVEPKGKLGRPYFKASVAGIVQVGGKRIDLSLPDDPPF